METGRRMVLDLEVLARFVVRRRWLRANRTVKAQAFVPDARRELSVFRHEGFSEEQLWATGRVVATMRSCSLYGRADVRADTIKGHALSFDPNDEPLNHVNVIGWPEDDAEKMEIAQSIADLCRFHAPPS